MPILQTLRADRALRMRFSAGAIVCTVSAIDVLVVGRRGEAVAQLTSADAMVLT